MKPRRAITLLVLGAVTLCPFNCVRHKAYRAGYFLRLAQASHTNSARITPPAPPRCQNETGCICQGVIFVAAPQVDDLAFSYWLALDFQLSEPPLNHGFGSEPVWLRHRRDEAPAPSGRALRALIASFQI